MSAAHSSFAHRTFFRLFPPPQFLTMPAVGLDISDHAIRFVELKESVHGLVVGKFGEQKLPTGTIDAGVIKDGNTLKTALIGLRREHGIEFVHALLPEEKAYLFRIEVPDLSAEETYDNIAFQLEEHAPISAAEAIFDYIIVDPLFGSVGAGMREALVSVFPQSVLEEHIEIYKGAGMTPLSFEMEGSALARSIVPFNDKGTYMIVDFGSERSGVLIVHHGSVHFTTTIEMGGGAITEAIAKKLSIGLEEAEALKRDGAFRRQGKYRELFPILVDAISDLREEINRLFVYWHNHPEKKGGEPPAIQKVLVTGGDADLEGLAEHFALSLNVPVEVANVWVNCFSTESYIPPISRNQSLSFASAIGLALRNQ